MKAFVSLLAIGALAALAVVSSAVSLLEISW